MLLYDGNGNIEETIMHRKFSVVAGIALIGALGMSAAPLVAPPKAKRKRPLQYKKPTRELITLAVGGQAAKAVKRCEAFLKANPKDTEHRFGLAVAYASLKQVDKAAEAMKLAVEAGVPFERFLAGPRDLLAPLVASDAFKEYAAKRRIVLIHGPMLGSVTHNSARFWVRTVAEVPVQVQVTAKRPTRWIKSNAVTAKKDSDYTAVLEIGGLKPNTGYVYRLTVGGALVVPFENMGFTTFPKRSGGCVFKIAFGGGAGYTPWKERMWSTIDKRRPLAMLLLGDNVYIDTPEVPQTQRYCYYRRQSRPEFRGLTGRMPVFAIYDDHDFGTNDCVPGPDIDEPAWKRPVWKVFTENWVNPYYGGGEKQPGCWFDFSIGDVDFIMVDGRYYRNKPKRGKASSMLGPVQKKWLLGKLKAAKGTFKVLAGPVPWTFDAKGTSGDTWNGFREERDEIFAFLAANRIDGVVLLSADRHRSDVWKIDRPRGYPLYEFESSRLTNVHVHRPMKGSLFSYNKKCSYGQLTFDTTKSDPTVTYRIFSIDDELIHTFEVKKSRISHKP